MSLNNLESMLSLSEVEIKDFSQRLIDEQLNLNKMVENFITCLVAKVLKNYDITPINSLSFNTDYPDANEGFSGNFMVLINARDPSIIDIDEDLGVLVHKNEGEELDFQELQRLLYDTVLPYQSLLKDNVYLTSHDLKTCMKILEVRDLDEHLNPVDSKRKSKKI